MFHVKSHLDYEAVKDALQTGQLTLTLQQRLVKITPDNYCLGQQTAFV